MQALRLIKNTGSDGEVILKIPKRYGNTVEIIVLPIREAADNKYEEKQIWGEKIDGESLFMAAAFEAVTEDDPEEDSVWRKYL